MRPVFCALSFVLTLGTAALATGSFVACDNSSSIVDAPGIKPSFLKVSGPQGGGLRCDPADAGANCPLPLHVTFQLPEGQFLAKAIVTFQGDGPNSGVDRYYAIPATYGKGVNTGVQDPALNVELDFEAVVPETVLRRNALFTYTVRFITGAGEESDVATLTVSVT